MFNGTAKEKTKQDSEYEARVLSERCWIFLRPLLQKMHKDIDRRLVQTFIDLVMIIIIHRHRNNGLLLSELGDLLLGGEHGPAGTKRIAKLIHSMGWTAQMVEDYLWGEGERKVRALQANQETIYVIWDESVIEKPESLQAEGLCAVRSSKAIRLKRIKPGFFNPPGGRPIFVPGMNWLQVIVVGMHGAPTLAHVRWWTTRGERSSNKRSEEEQVLKKVNQLWGRQVIHVWDRGFAGAPWTSLALDHEMGFIVRWKKDYKLVGPDSQLKKPWEIGRGKRSWDHKMVHDAQRRCDRKTGVVAFPVHLPDDPRPLWLVISRPGKGRKPWYLITSEPVESIDDAWRIVFAYAPRWQIEVSIRFTKAELAFESPRLQKWDHRLKFLMIASMAYAFLLSLLTDLNHLGLVWLLDFWCHRTGKRSRTSTPFFRLRLALSRLWLDFRPPSLPKLAVRLN